MNDITDVSDDELRMFVDYQNGEFESAGLDFFFKEKNGMVSLCYYGTPDTDAESMSQVDSREKVIKWEHDRRKLKNEVQRRDL
ncbi:hypothetical protein KU306_11085 [Haloferax larsenii]|uniref:Uncharacterized protein n=1 Tax=Haloferax larsenii TaxID=302484 RepID=A0ABY5RAX6_HALLR|nr:hypothetical protein [Haloferax larsenii]UVE49461.1 hypothetical protein KU306_11085 [Haloferax larsenii]